MATPITSTQDPKRCSTCKQSKPLSEFYTKRSRSPIGLVLYHGRCKVCSMARARVRTEGPQRVELLARRRARYEQLKASGKANWGYEDRMYRRLYRSTQEAYDLQFAAQNGRCAVCLRLPAVGEARFAYDHDHETGETRGVLCPSCNGGLGCFRDNPEHLKAAISYLRDWATLHTVKVSNE